jgi:hypothetical protein
MPLTKPHPWTLNLPHFYSMDTTTNKCSQVVRLCGFGKWITRLGFGMSWRVWNDQGLE